MNSKKNDKRKRHYRAMAFGNKKSKLADGKNVLQESLQGFIIVCNGREKDAIREAYRILNETADADKKIEDNVQNSEEADIDTALAQEKAQLISNDNKDFQLVYTAGVSNFMFIKSIPDPLPIANTIIQSIIQEREPRTRSLIRLIPIQTVCKAYPDPIQSNVTTLLRKHDSCNSPVTYCVAFKSRFNNNLLQTEALNAVNTAVKEATKGSWSIQLKDCDYVIVLEVVTSYCCIGVLPQYQQRKKYNLIELAKKPLESKASKTEDENKDNEGANDKMVKGSNSPGKSTASKPEEKKKDIDKTLESINCPEESTDKNDKEIPKVEINNGS
uniref:THUMP domain-containing protein 1 n=1 Tax=Caligus clemensi TaxID=344056 RepID=C1C277_CALCM|nr:THUMP domain-containing protein 1 [Caligus clemensi]